MSGAVQINGRSILLNSFSPEAFMLPVDVEKVNILLLLFFFFYATESVNPLDSAVMIHEAWQVGFISAFD